MFDTTEQILDRLRAGEDGLEFKKVRLGDRDVLSPDTEALAGELVAFANAAGGGVFLGSRIPAPWRGFRRRTSTRSSAGGPTYNPSKLPDTITLGEMPYRHAHAQPDPGKLSVQNLEQAAKAARAVNFRIARWRLRR